ncbi:MAG: MlaE family ABC transporter permease [Bacteriovoracia bacterium]
MITMFVETAQGLGQILAKTLYTCIKGPYRDKEVFHHMYFMGIKSLPIITISTGFAGLVVTREIAYHMDLALHSVEMIPGFSGQFVFRELGIAIPALFLVSKVGAATAAEISTMQVTEQIDALRLLQIDPVEYLVYPRFVASVIVSASLILISIFVTLAAAIFVAVFKYNFSVLEYLNTLTHFISLKDLLWTLIKGMTFGGVIPIVSCYYGFQCKGGAEGVGHSTTNSVVTSTILIIILDFILTFAFSKLA